MEKDKIMDCHEKFIRGTYDSIKEFNYWNVEVDEKILLTQEKYQQDNNLSQFYQEYATLIMDKTLNTIEIEQERADLLLSRTRIFFELGLISEDEKNELMRYALDLVIRSSDVEYKLMLLKLVSIADDTSKEYVDLVNYIYKLKSDGAILKQNVLKKDI